MASLAQPPVSRERFTTLVTELFGAPPATPPAAGSPSAPPQDWPQAVTRVTEQLCARLGVPVAPERLRKALDLVLTHAVTLHADGTASVQSGTQTYTLAPDCRCGDATNRTEFCKHTLAVELHRRALALLDGWAHTPAAPSQAPAAATAPPAAPSTPSAAHWGTTEAPASCNIKLRVGNMELWYTARDVDDTTLQQRLQAVLPWLKDILVACEADYAARQAAQHAPAQQPPAVPQGDLHALAQQAVQQALAAQSNGQAHSTPPPAAPRPVPAPPAPDGPPLCPLHQVAMELRQNARGSWWSHRLADGAYCKGK